MADAPDDQGKRSRQWKNTLRRKKGKSAQEGGITTENNAEPRAANDAAAAEGNNEAGEGSKSFRKNTIGRRKSRNARDGETTQKSEGPGDHRAQNFAAQGGNMRQANIVRDGDAPAVYAVGSDPSNTPNPTKNYAVRRWLPSLRSGTPSDPPSHLSSEAPSHHPGLVEQGKIVASSMAGNVVRKTSSGCKNFAALFTGGARQQDAGTQTEPLPHRTELDAMAQAMVMDQSNAMQQAANNATQPQFNNKSEEHHEQSVANATQRQPTNEPEANNEQPVTNASKLPSGSPSPRSRSVVSGNLQDSSERGQTIAGGIVGSTARKTSSGWRSYVPGLKDSARPRLTKKKLAQQTRAHDMAQAMAEYNARSHGAINVAQHQPSNEPELSNEQPATNATQQQPKSEPEAKNDRSAAKSSGVMTKPATKDKGHTKQDSGVHAGQDPQGSNSRGDFSQVEWENTEQALRGEGNSDKEVVHTEDRNEAAGSSEKTVPNFTKMKYQDETSGGVGRNAHLESRDHGNTFSPSARPSGTVSPRTLLPLVSSSAGRSTRLNVFLAVDPAQTALLAKQSAALPGRSSEIGAAAEGHFALNNQGTDQYPPHAQLHQTVIKEAFKDICAFKWVDDRLRHYTLVRANQSDKYYIKHFKDQRHKSQTEKTRQQNPNTRDRPRDDENHGEFHDEDGNTPEDVDDFIDELMANGAQTMAFRENDTRCREKANNGIVHIYRCRVTQEEMKWIQIELKQDDGRTWYEAARAVDRDGQPIGLQLSDEQIDVFPYLATPTHTLGERLPR